VSNAVYFVVHVYNTLVARAVSNAVYFVVHVYNTLVERAVSNAVYFVVHVYNTLVARAVSNAVYFVVHVYNTLVVRAVSNVVYFVVHVYNTSRRASCEQSSNAVSADHFAVSIYTPTTEFVSLSVRITDTPGWSPSTAIKERKGSVFI